MNKKISIGIAGAGVFGGHHASKYATHDQAALTGVYDPDVVRAEQLAGRFGATAYGDYADFLSKTDAVVIAAPAICHFDLASAALKAGLHVFVEKPLALHVDDADKLIELADANQVILQVGHQERYVLEAAGLFSRDRAPVKIDCVRRGKESGRCEDVSVAFDLMIHDLDIIRHLTDSEVTKVNANGDAHEASAQLVLANGAVASLNASRRAPALERRMTLVFDDGVVEIDFVSREISNTTPAEFDLEFQSASAGKAASDPLGFGADQFISAILSGNEPIVSGRHGRIAVDWARRVESASDGGRYAGRATGGCTRMNSVANLALASETQVGNIAFIDLQAQQRRIRPAVERRLQAVLDHGRYIAGPEIAELEQKLAERTGAKAAIACASGTAALIIPLLAKEIGAGDAVFVPAFTYNATANAVLLTGATPVFVDIDPDTFNMDVAHLERCIADLRSSGELTPRAVIPVDLFGSPADYRNISKIAEKENLFMLSDGAQSYGGMLDNRWVGDLAPATATSFFPGKALGAYGDAGAIFTQDDDAAALWESIRWHGTDEHRKDSVRVGFNGRMDSFQAAVLLEKMAIFDDELAQRRRVANIYNERLGRIGRPQQHLSGASSSYGYYALCVENRDQVVADLNTAGVPTAVYYTTPLHKMQAFEKFAPKDGLPTTERIATEIFSLPMHPYLTPEQVDYICNAVETAVG